MDFPYTVDVYKYKSIEYIGKNFVTYVHTQTFSYSFYRYHVPINVIGKNLITMITKLGKRVVFTLVGTRFLAILVFNGLYYIFIVQHT